MKVMLLGVINALCLLTVYKTGGWENFSTDAEERKLTKQCETVHHP